MSWVWLLRSNRARAKLWQRVRAHSSGGATPQGDSRLATVADVSAEFSIGMNSFPAGISGSRGCRFVTTLRKCVPVAMTSQHSGSEEYSARLSANLKGLLTGQKLPLPLAALEQQPC
jgi:hypothetical protein